jgi:hypothetical protein
MIAAKILRYYWIDGKKNPVDSVRKNWSYPQVWHLLKSLLFYSGATMDLINPDEKEKTGNSNKLCWCCCFIICSSSASNQIYTVNFSYSLISYYFELIILANKILTHGSPKKRIDLIINPRFCCCCCCYMDIDYCLPKVYTTIV